MNLVKENHALNETHSPSSAVQRDLTDEPSHELGELPALALDERGMIRHCNKSGESFFDYRPHDLVWQHVSILFPQLKGVELVQDGRFNPSLNFLCRCEHLFQAQNRQGDLFSCHLSFIHFEHDDRRTLRLIVSPSDNEKA